MSCLFLIFLILLTFVGAITSGKIAFLLGLPLTLLFVIGEIIKEEKGAGCCCVFAIIVIIIASMLCLWLLICKVVPIVEAKIMGK